MATGPQFEKLVIRALCVGTPQGAVKDAAMPLLRHYTWQLPLYQVIFDVLAGIPSNDSTTICQLLPAKLVRRGFPEVEWEEFFAPLTLSRDEILALVRRMATGEQSS